MQLVLVVVFVFIVFGDDQLNGNLQSRQEAKHFWAASPWDKASENHRA